MTRIFDSRLNVDHKPTKRKLYKRPASAPRMQQDVPRSTDEMDQGLRQFLMEILHGERPWPLYLWGDAGRGKTCASLIMCDLVLNSRYWTMETFVEVSFLPHASVWGYLATADLAVIDEIGVRTEQGDREYLALKRAARLREFLPTIWISNQSPDVIRQIYDDRIFSRLTCGEIVELEGEDRRPAARRM